MIVQVKRKGYEKYAFLNQYLALSHSRNQYNDHITMENEHNLVMCRMVPFQ